MIVYNSVCFCFISLQERSSGRSRGFGYVTFASAEDAKVREFVLETILFRYSFYSSLYSVLYGHLLGMLSGIVPTECIIRRTLPQEQNAGG